MKLIKITLAAMLCCAILAGCSTAPNADTSSSLPDTSSMSDDSSSSQPPATPDDTAKAWSSTLTPMGTKTHGYIDLPDNWIANHGENPEQEMLVQYLDVSGKNIITLSTVDLTNLSGLSQASGAAIPSVATVDSFALLLAQQLTGSQFVDIENGTATLDGVEAQTLSARCDTPEYKANMQYWIFKADETTLNVICAEAPNENIAAVCKFVTDSYSISLKE